VTTEIIKSDGSSGADHPYPAVDLSGRRCVAQQWEGGAAVGVADAMWAGPASDRTTSATWKLSFYYLNPLLSSSRLPHSRYSLRSRGHQFSLSQLCVVLFRNNVVNQCSFQYIQLYNLSSLSCAYSFVTFLFCVVLKVQMSSLFIKAYLT